MSNFKTYKGIFVPTNPQKYKGNVNEIIYRSGWEKRVMKWLDENPNVIEWSSEELVIPYISPHDNRRHRYFPDFLVKVRLPDNTTKIYVLEVKPKKQTKEPKPQKRRTRKYIEEVFTWGKNQAKWKFAEEFCAQRGWEFMIITESDIGLEYK